MTTTMKPPTRFLTHDEIITMPDKFGVEFPFRLRVWMGPHATTVVLVSQYMTAEVSWMGPRTLTTKLANFVHEAVLRYPDNGMLYFEDESDPRDGQWKLNSCSFSYYGYAYRIKMFHPERNPYTWEKFEFLVGGGPVERLMY